MNKYIKDQVREHCLSAVPQEACGLVACNYVTGAVTVYPCENKAVDKLTQFEVDLKDFVYCREKYGEIIAVYHSHSSPDFGRGVGFSPQDIDQCNECLTPFLLYTHPEDEFLYLEPEGYQRKPLVGRPFVRGLWDCYTICRDYYRQGGLELGYYFPPEDDALDGYDHFEANFEKEGFKEIPFSEAKKGDALLFKVGKSETINHAGIFLGGKSILHQPIKGISCIIDIDHRLMKYHHMVVRNTDYEYGENNFTR